MNSENDGDDGQVSRRSVIRAGAAAAAATAATGTAAAQEEGGDGEGSSSGEKIVKVGPNGQNIFDPAELYVTPGTTVRFVWEGSGHNVHATEVPGDAEWSAKTEITGPPMEYEYTFDGPMGEYNYVCDPHASVGMEGTIIVTDSPPENEGYQTLVPDSAKTLAVAAVGSMTSVLGIAYFFMKYGGDYDGEFEE
ncbi:plastocyanin/azurin family copper-binding protein [Halobacterium jilantaiense]|uniref:Plastocyanin n=1 Tax=Halobacterium jilantaiense TaxID=355548 RepID=A0A1I0NKZ7_9EURY|nr:plastocyanin/azurin family copper-binding protein [Halobacterium jilantaiense]SEW02131.1 Plastocyanin [Halobacterium jilantaiense]